MDPLWRINASSCNGFNNISTGWLYELVGRTDIVELATYARKWCYFVLICFELGLMDRDQGNVRSSLLSLNCFHRTVGETVPTLYPKSLIYVRMSMNRVVLRSDRLSEMYSISVDMRDISVWIFNFYINGHPKYDITNNKWECVVYESSWDSSGNQLPLKPASAHTLMLLSRA